MTLFLLGLIVNTHDYKLVYQEQKSIAASKCTGWEPR